MSKYLLAIFIFLINVDQILNAQAVPVEFRSKSSPPKPVVKNKEPKKDKHKVPLKSNVQNATGTKIVGINNKPSGGTTPNEKGNELLTANFSTTESCDLEIDGKSYGMIQSGVAKPLKLSVGRHQLKAKGKTSSQVYEKTFDIVRGDNQFLIPLAEIAVNRQRQQDSLITKTTGALVIDGNEKGDTSDKENNNISGSDLAEKDNDPVNSLASLGKDSGSAVDKSRPKEERTAFKGQVLAVTEELRANMVPLKGGIYRMVQFKGGVSKTGGSKDVAEYQINLGPFFFGKYEVTQQEWETVMGSNPSVNKNCKSCPVENVSWEEVNRFIQILNELGSVQFRLPTEAEWQFVAQLDGKAEIEKEGGLSQFLKKTTWYMENTRKTHPVGEKTAHTSGVYDLFGNVSEWCSDWYGDDYSGKVNIMDNPKGPANGKERVIRGGAFNDDKILQKDKLMPEKKSKSVGFRLVCEVL